MARQAAVDLAVTHAKSDPRTQRFSGLVNGVLRTLARIKEAELPGALAATDEAPKWFSDRLKTAYGADKTKLIGLRPPDSRTAPRMHDRVEGVRLLRERAGRRRMIEGWGGTIAIQSTPGAGVHVRIALVPASPA